MEEKKKYTKYKMLVKNRFRRIPCIFMRNTQCSSSMCYANIVLIIMNLLDKNFIS